MEPKTPQELLSYLQQREIGYHLHTHPPLHTVEDALRERGHLGGSYVKNLYLKDRKGQMALIVCLNIREVNLQKLRRAIGYRRLSLASEETLWRDLGVRPGSVSPLALINASPSTLTLFADQDLLEEDLTNLHPLTNEMTVQLACTDWVKLCIEWGFDIQWIDFNALPEEDD
jgi:Ala-tRNA(Pro) deacylase